MRLARLSFHGRIPVHTNVATRPFAWLHVQDFATIWQSMVATFSALNGGLEYQAFLASRNPVLMSAVYVIFQFAMVMVLANLIMGFVVNGVSKVGSCKALPSLSTHPPLHL